MEGSLQPSTLSTSLSSLTTNPKILPSQELQSLEENNARIAFKAAVVVALQLNILTYVSGGFVGVAGGRVVEAPRLLLDSSGFSRRALAITIRLWGHYTSCVMLILYLCFLIIMFYHGGAKD